MTQPPYRDPDQPQSPPPYGYPPPVDPFATTPPPSAPPPGPPPPTSPPGGFPPPAAPGPAYPPAAPGPAYPPAAPGPAYPPAAGYPPAAPGHDPTYGHQQAAPGYDPTYGHQQAAPGYDPTYGYQPPPPAPKKRRGLLITGIVLGVALLLCGGGGTAAYLFLRQAEGQGAESPQVAVNDFLVAVFSEHDAGKAEDLVCSDARDRAQIQKKIDEVKSYGDKYNNAKFSWPEPTVAETKDDTARVNVKVRITTEDERLAEQQLSFSLVKRTGWFICEVQSG